MDLSVVAGNAIRIDLFDTFTMVARLRLHRYAADDLSKLTSLPTANDIVRD